MASKVRLGLGPLGSSVLTPVVKDGTSVTVFSGSVLDPFDGLYVEATPAGVDLGEVVSSAPSIVSFHPTLFEDFALDARPTYNFYTPEELLDSAQDPSASLGSLPRYVTLSWDPVPNSQVLTFGQKRVRPPDPRAKGIRPVLDIGQASAAVSNGHLSPGVVAALLVPPLTASTVSTFDEDSFLLSDAAGGHLAAAHVENRAYEVRTPPAQPTRIRAQFVDPSIVGALSQNRIDVASDHVHLATLGSFSKLAAGLEVLSEFNQDVPIKNPPPRFPAPYDSLTLAYLGYVIERYTLDASGSMQLSRTINLDDPSQTSFVDRDVVYEGRYAYRIRSIVQWTHPSDVDFTGPSSLDRAPVFNPAAGRPHKVASFYAGAWSDWARAAVIDSVPPDPPEEIYVRPISAKGLVDVAWKVPGDPQRDLRSLRLVRCTLRDGRLSDWTLLAEVPPQNGRYADADVSPFEVGQTEYVYAMYSTSHHGEASVLSAQFQARLTKRSQYLGEEPIRQIAPAGADRAVHPGSPPTDGVELVARDAVRLYIRSSKSSLPLFQRDYVLEVRSLSTGERVEVPISVETTDVDVGKGKPLPRGKGQATAVLLSPAAMAKRS